MNTIIAIPTFNRAESVRRAVVAALDQQCNGLNVVVVDDGSLDDTQAALAPFFDDPRFSYLKLAHNVGTAKAKNVAICLVPFDAITFHDSDDVPHPLKLLRQTQILALPAVNADSCLPWHHAGHVADRRLDVGVVLTQHELLTSTGHRFVVKRALSLIDDFFPNLQMNAGLPGDWILINSGLFRRKVFIANGGFEDCIEEDRELRNRLIMAGEIIWVIDEPLLTKIDSPDSLTAHAATGYQSERRRRDREMVWGRVADWKKTEMPKVTIDLSDIEIAFTSRHARLTLAEDIRMTAETETHLAGQIRLATKMVT